MGSAVATIRAMTTSDLPEVLAIEAESHPSPWTETIFAEELARDWARLMVVSVPASDDAQVVVAFCNYWLVADELQLLNICSASGYRRNGYGKLLMDHLIDVARDRECRLITLEVRVSNTPAIALYERYGFEGSGVRAAYYSDTGEDALVMLLNPVPARPPA